jgi:hypothetical protein
MKRLVTIALVAACSKDLHHTVDALPGDAPGDTLVPSGNDPPAGAVTLTVKRGNATVPNVAVFFQDPASTLIEQKLTNESGLAFALMPGGGFVTAVEHVGQGLDEITTFASVAPSDALRLDFMDPGQRKEWPIQLSFSADTGGTATSYVVRTSCSSETFSAKPVPVAADDNQVTLSGCDDGLVDFAIESFDVDGVPTGRALYEAAVMLPAPLPPTDAGTAFAPLTLSATFAPVETHTIDYVNVPTSLSAVAVMQAISAERRTYEVTNSAPRSTSSTTTSMSLVLPAGATTQLTATVGYPSSSTAKSQYQVFDWGPASTAYSLDVSQSILPGYIAGPVYDPASRAITWTEGTAVVQPDLVRARIHVHRDAFPEGSSWGWRIVAPRSAAATVVYPQLPNVGFDFNPQDGDVYGVDELTNVKLPGGYAAWRPRAFLDFAHAVTGPSGSIYVETLYSPEL